MVGRVGGDWEGSWGEGRSVGLVHLGTRLLAVPMLHWFTCRRRSETSDTEIIIQLANIIL